MTFCSAFLVTEPLHLAICNLLHLMFFIDNIHAIFNDNTRVSLKSHILCNIWSPMHTLWFIAGIYFVVLISVSRYRAIVQQFKPPIGRKMLKILSASIYLIAVLCIIPHVLVLKFDERRKANKCFEECSKIRVKIERPFGFALSLSSVSQPSKAQRKLHG